MRACESCVDNVVKIVLGFMTTLSKNSDKNEMSGRTIGYTQAGGRKGRRVDQDCFAHRQW